MKITPFPELITHAEEEAQAHFDASADAILAECPADEHYRRPAFDSDGQRHLRIATHLALLTNLSHRSSYLVLLSLIAAKVGADASRGVTVRRRCLSDTEVQWSLHDADGVGFLYWGDELWKWPSQYPMKLTPEQRVDQLEAIAALVATLWPPA